MKSLVRGLSYPPKGSTSNMSVTNDIWGELYSEKRRILAREGPSKIWISSSITIHASKGV